MAEHDTVAEARVPWYRKVAMVILFPFVLPTIPVVLAILLAFGTYAFIHNFVSECLFRARMRHCGRFLRWRQLSARIAEEGAGSLIIESPSLGWGFTHAWWTPENVLKICPHDLPNDEEYRGAAQKMQCLDWDRWFWKNYTDPDNGKGYLLRVWNGRSLEKWVKRSFPSVVVVNTWTALVHFPNATLEQSGA
jgi:hypothetical protein